MKTKPSDWKFAYGADGEEMLAGHEPTQRAALRTALADETLLGYGTDSLYITNAVQFNTADFVAPHVKRIAAGLVEEIDSGLGEVGADEPLCVLADEKAAVRELTELLEGWAAKHIIIPRPYGWFYVPHGSKTWLVGKLLDDWKDDPEVQGWVQAREKAQAEAQEEEEGEA